jgi:hypothetical protein
MQVLTKIILTLLSQLVTCKDIPTLLWTTNHMEFVVFLVVAPCSVVDTNVSEDRDASIFRILAPCLFHCYETVQPKLRFTVHGCEFHRIALSRTLTNDVWREVKVYISHLPEYQFVDWKSNWNINKSCTPATHKFSPVKSSIIFRQQARFCLLCEPITFLPRISFILVNVNTVRWQMCHCRIICEK